MRVDILFLFHHCDLQNNREYLLNRNQQDSDLIYRFKESLISLCFKRTNASKLL